MDKVTKNDDTNRVVKEESRVSAKAETRGEQPEVEAITFTFVANFKCYIHYKILFLFKSSSSFKKLTD